MEYIDKDALVAEIEKLKEIYSKSITHNNYEDGLKEGRIIGYEDILRKINTFEVKEVDLEKEFDNYTKNILACDVQFEPFTHLYNCAKHFFELGLKAQKGG